ncbi:MAG: hypothetical protein U0Z44_12835 [Kouleothrix sp.]
MAHGGGDPLLPALTFAGALFLSFRQISRLYFVYFGTLLDLVALLVFWRDAPDCAPAGQQSGTWPHPDRRRGPH